MKVQQMMKGALGTAARTLQAREGKKRAFRKPVTFQWIVGFINQGQTTQKDHQQTRFQVFNIVN